jgi:predicted patatin/cPLA2 family phospholipase
MLMGNGVASEKHTRRCLVLQGGGLRGAFSAGACLALGDIGITDFDSAFAVSASVPTLAYSLAGQCREGKEVWENYLATKKLVRYRSLLSGWAGDYIHRPVLDVHYLVFEVFRDRFPLNVARLMESPTRAYFVAMDAETCEPHYFEKSRDGMYQIMWACLSLPGACPERPIVDGRRYIDGGVVDPIPIEKALQTGAERLLVVLTMPLDAVITETGRLGLWLTRRYFRDNPGLLGAIKKRREVYARSLELLQELRSALSQKVYVVAPKSWPPADRITRSRSRIARTLAMGYEEIMRNRNAIEEFLQHR